MKLLSFIKIKKKKNETMITKYAHPVSSLKGRSLEKPRRLLMIHCDATKLITAKKQTMHNHIMLVHAVIENGLVC